MSRNLNCQGNDDGKVLNDVTTWSVEAEVDHSGDDEDGVCKDPFELLHDAVEIDHLYKGDGQ